MSASTSARAKAASTALFSLASSCHGNRVATEPLHAPSSGEPSPLCTVWHWQSAHVNLPAWHRHVCPAMGFSTGHLPCNHHCHKLASTTAATCAADSSKAHVDSPVQLNTARTFLLQGTRNALGRAERHKRLILQTTGRPVSEGTNLAQVAQKSKGSPQGAKWLKLVLHFLSIPDAPC